MTSSIVSRSFASVGIRIRQADRYVSLTDMAQASGKLFADWQRLKTSKSYMAALSSNMGIPILGLIEVKVGGDHNGSWGHPKLALRFAQWCSDDFAIQVDTWLDELLTTGSVHLDPSAKTRQALPSGDIGQSIDHITVPAVEMSTLDDAFLAIEYLKDIREAVENKANPLRAKLTAFMVKNNIDRYQLPCGLVALLKERNSYELETGLKFDDIDPFFLRQTIDGKAVEIALNKGLFALGVVQNKTMYFQSSRKEAWLQMQNKRRLSC